MLHYRGRQGEGTVFLPCLRCVWVLFFQDRYGYEMVFSCTNLVERWMISKRIIVCRSESDSFMVSDKVVCMFVWQSA